MEHRDDGLLVDYSGSIELQGNGQRQGNYPVVYNAKQEKEMETLDQETRLMRAMNEIRAYTPKSMNAENRQRFAIMCEGIFRKHGITAENYRDSFAHLGTADQLHR